MEDQELSEQVGRLMRGEAIAAWHAALKGIEPHNLIARGVLLSDHVKGLTPSDRHSDRLIAAAFMFELLYALRLAVTDGLSARQLRRRIRAPGWKEENTQAFIDYVGLPAEN